MFANAEIVKSQTFNTLSGLWAYVNGVQTAELKPAIPNADMLGLVVDLGCSCAVL